MCRQAAGIGEIPSLVALLHKPLLLMFLKSIKNFVSVSFAQLIAIHGLTRHSIVYSLSITGFHPLVS